MPSERPTCTMNTPATESPRKRTRYVVTKDGVACGFILAKKFKSRTRGVLGKKPERPHRFSTRTAADHAINKTTTTAAMIKGSMIDGWSLIAPLMEPGKWAVVTEHEAKKGAS